MVMTLHHDMFELLFKTFVFSLPACLFFISLLIEYRPSTEMKGATLLAAFVLFVSRGVHSDSPTPDNKGYFNFHWGVPDNGFDKTSTNLMLLSVPTGKDRSAFSNDVMSPLSSALVNKRRPTPKMAVSSASSQQGPIGLQRLLKLRRKQSQHHADAFRIPGSVNHYPLSMSKSMIYPSLDNVAIFPDNQKFSYYPLHFPFKSDSGQNTIPLPPPVVNTPQVTILRPRAKIHPSILALRHQPTILVQHQPDSNDNFHKRAQQAESVDRRVVFVQHPTRKQLADRVAVRPKYVYNPASIMMVNPVAGFKYSYQYPWLYQKIPLHVGHGHAFSIQNTSGGGASNGGDSGSGSSTESPSNNGQYENN